MILITDTDMHQPGDSTAAADPGASFINSTADITALVKHKFVIHVVDADWGDGDRNPRVLATNTGGAAYDLPLDGSVDLMALPIKDMLKSGYAITFTTGRLGTTHSIRLVVTTPAAKEAEMTYSAFY